MTKNTSNERLSRACDNLVRTHIYEGSTEVTIQASKTQIGIVLRKVHVNAQGNAICGDGVIQ